MAQQITLLGVGDTLANRYKLVEELGRGSYGVVWRAQQADTDHQVAIKTLLPQAFLDPEIPERFDREIQLVSRLKHPNIITLYDHGHHNGLLYMAIEYVEGRSLGELIKKDTPMPARDAIALTKQILSALAHAHELGIVHRDLKPENILLNKPAAGSEEEQVKVLDFGIAKLVRTARDGGADFKTLTQSGHVLGTPHYMSPEQIVGDGIDHRTDLYAIGVILYELLTGTHPFDAPNSTAVMVRHLRDDPAPLPPPLKTTRWPQLIERALAKQPEERFADARAFLDALDRVEPLTVAAERAVKRKRATTLNDLLAPAPARGVEISDPTLLAPAYEDATQRLDVSQLGDDDDEQTRKLDLEAVHTNLWQAPQQLQGHPLFLDDEPPQLASLPKPSPLDSSDALHITPPSRPAHNTLTGQPLTPSYLPERQPSRYNTLQLALIAALALFILVAGWMVMRPSQTEQPPPPLTPSTAAQTPPAPTRPSTQQDEDKAPSDEVTKQDKPVVEDGSSPDGRETADDKLAIKKPVTKPEKKPEKTRPDKKRPVKDTPSPVVVRITSEPPKARVVIDGKHVGDTPLNYTASKPDEKLTVKLTLIGYAEEVKHVIPAKQGELNIRLNRARINLIP